ncbi:MAG: carbohydrate-binding domain-containing protein [Clostridioides sp.]|jgi:hypothetical protein|nr:carbohydrate-binding domain-containing protein [Clostridioides sp.]
MENKKKIITVSLIMLGIIVVISLIKFTNDNNTQAADNTQTSTSQTQTLEATSGELILNNRTITDVEQGIKLKEDTVITLIGDNVIKASADGINSTSNLTIKGTGTLTIESGDDGIHTDEDLIIESGTIKIVKSNEGLEGKNITINGGNIDITSSDDGLNASGDEEFGDYKITINGGDLKINAQGDGIDSNGSITINGGNIYSFINSRANSAIDATTVNFNGGNIYYGGTATDEGISENSTQSYIYASGTFKENDKIIVKKDGKTITEFTIYLDSSNIAISTKDIKKGETYEIYSGETKITDAVAGEGGSGNIHGGGGRPGNFGNGEMPQGEGNFPNGKNFPNDMKAPDSSKNTNTNENISTN